jgi:hypothetical protein
VPKKERPSNDLRLVIRSLGITAVRNDRHAASTAATALIRGERATRVTRTWVRYGGAAGVLLRGMAAALSLAIDIVPAHAGALYLVIAPGATLAPDQRYTLAGLRMVPRTGAFPSASTTVAHPALSLPPMHMALS